MASLSNEYDIGVIGLGAMGRNLLLNIADHGFKVIGFNRDVDRAQRVIAEASPGTQVAVTQDKNKFVQSLRKPRAVLLLVPAGSAVDDVINEYSPLLSEGDLIIDAGNSHYKDTDLREKSLTLKGLRFFGMGVSGGEAGARNGPSLMPGGDKLAYERVRPILEAIAAKVNGDPCVTYLGPRSAGHYVKMVHNGIEYGLMQLIAESYQLMKSALQMSDQDCHDVFQEWNGSELSSYLLEITAKIFLKMDDKTNKHLIDVVLDVAKQKGTGNWMCQDAMDLQIPVPTIDAAVAARDLSAFASDRKQAHAVLGGSKIDISFERKTLISQMRNAYYASSIITFAQGMALLRKASSEYKYDLNLESVARIWRGGCIIRAALLEPIMSAFRSTPDLTNLLLDSHLGREVVNRQADIRAVVQTAAQLGLPAPCTMSAIAYYDGLCSDWLPANLTQAQRDFFGAHTYERVDRQGSFHTNWEMN